MASSATMKDQRRSAAFTAFKGSTLSASGRPWSKIFLRTAIGVVVLWTLATMLWAIDPVFLVQTGNLVAAVFGSFRTHV